MKKTWILLIFPGLITTLSAQKVDMQSFVLNDRVFSRPTVIGKVGTHYMVYDEYKGWPSLIYTFDSSFKLSNTTEQYISAKPVQFRISDEQLYITWMNRIKDSVFISVNRLDEWGNVNVFLRNSFFFPTKNASPPFLVTDIGNHYFLFYSLVKDSDQETYLRMVLLDTAWNERKNATYHVTLDKKLDAMTPPMVDASGNIHFGVYDRLSNYHLSSTLTVFTIPLEKDSILSTSTQTDELKFFGFSFGDDTIAKRINLLGYYYDGQNKIKKGIASLQLSYADSGQKIHAQYHPFPRDLEIILRSNLRYDRKKDDPAENIRTREIYQRNGNIFVSNWLIDLPNHMIPKDGDIGKEIPEKKAKKQPVNHLSAESPIVYPGSNNSYDFNLGYTVPMIQKPATPRSAPTYYNSFHFIPPIDNWQKAIYFSIDKTGDYRYFVLPDAEINPLSGNLKDYPLAYRGGFVFLSNETILVSEAGTKTAKSRITFTTSDNHGGRTKLADFDATNYIFFQPAAIADGKYMGPYFNYVSRQSGIVVWSFEDSK